MKLSNAISDLLEEPERLVGPGFALLALAGFGWLISRVVVDERKKWRERLEKQNAPMPNAVFKFECTHCGQRIAALLSDVGTGGACPGCGHQFIVPNALASSVITPPPLPINVRPRRDFIVGYLVALGFGFAIALLMDNFIMGFPISVGLVIATHWEVQKGKSPFHYAVSGTIVVIGVFYARKWGWL